MRRGELLSLRWCDVDLEQRVAHLAMTKNGDARGVPLSSRAINAMRELRTERTAPTDKLFPSARSLEQTWMRLRERAGIENCASMTTVTKASPACSSAGWVSPKWVRSAGTRRCGC